jgi:hypothetical protein
MLYGQDRAEALDSLREEIEQHEFKLQVAKPGRAETLAAINSVPAGLETFFAAWAVAASERWIRAKDCEYAETFLRIAAELHKPKVKEMQPCLASA